MEEEEKEIWKQIVHKDVTYDYEVSNLGNIRSLKSKKLRKLSKSGRYVTTNLTQGDNREPKIIHCLVAEAFVPNDDPTKIYVNHINHDKYDNRAVNLEWTTHPENVKHSYTNEDRVLLGQHVYKHDVETNEIIKEYKSKSEASRDLQISLNTITRLIQVKDTKYGYYLTYKTPPIAKDIVTDLTGFVVIQNYENYMVHPEGKVYSKYTQILLKPRFNTKLETELYAINAL